MVAHGLDDKCRKKRSWRTMKNAALTVAACSAIIIQNNNNYGCVDAFTSGVTPGTTTTTSTSSAVHARLLTPSSSPREDGTRSCRSGLNRRESSMSNIDGANRGNNIECSIRIPNEMFVGARTIQGTIGVGVSGSTNNYSRYGGRATPGGYFPPHHSNDDIKLQSNIDGNRRPILGFRVGDDTDADDITSSNDDSDIPAPVEISSWLNGATNNGIRNTSPIKNSLLGQATSYYQQQQQQQRQSNKFASPLNTDTINNSQKRSGSLSSVVPGWFPWIPTKSQIQLLKVIELREVCSDRSLSKSGNKAALQNRVWDWTKQQHKIRLANRNRDQHQGHNDQQKESTYEKMVDDSELLSLTSATVNEESTKNKRTTGNQQEQEKSLFTTDYSPEIGFDQSIEKNSLQKKKSKNKKVSSGNKKSTTVPHSFKEWEDESIERLTNRRNAIRKEQMEGKKPPPKKKEHLSPKAQNSTKEDFVEELTKTFFNDEGQMISNNQYSNIDITKMYNAAKRADQAGKYEKSKQLLLKLKDATKSNDARIFRRLSRMEYERGNVIESIDILKEGIAVHPNNGYLFQGLGQIYSKIGNVNMARTYYEKGIDVDPTIPNTYHALGLLEHMYGSIAKATSIIKQGILYCPTNHRLHHALGDIYREANNLLMAEKSYNRALQYSSTTINTRGNDGKNNDAVAGGGDGNAAFALVSLAMISYEKQDYDKCRTYLHKAISLNNGRNNRAWIALGQVEESLGNIYDARAVYIDAINTYEHYLLERHNNSNKKKKKKKSKNQQSKKDDDNVSRNFVDILMKKTINTTSVNEDNDPVQQLRNDLLLTSIPTYRSGDKFISVYKNWARFETKYSNNNNEIVDDVYTRATIAFPKEYEFYIQWAKYYGDQHYNKRRDNNKNNNNENRHIDLVYVSKARELYEKACTVTFDNHADPYRLYAEFEMKMNNYDSARQILYRGAQTMSNSNNGCSSDKNCGIVQLYHTWAICEWHLNNLGRSEVLFDHALRLTDSGHDGNRIRSYIFHSIAKLEYYRGEYELAQHFIGLSLKEDGSSSSHQVWSLWADVAYAMGNDRIATECIEQAKKLKDDEDNGNIETLSQLLHSTRSRGSKKRQQQGGAGGEDNNSSNSHSSSPSYNVKQKLMKRDPWADKIFGPPIITNEGGTLSGFDGIEYPSKKSVVWKKCTNNNE